MMVPSVIYYFPALKETSEEAILKVVKLNIIFYLRQGPHFNGFYFTGRSVMGEWEMEKWGMGKWKMGNGEWKLD